jgi:hypothetical protein
MGVITLLYLNVKKQSFNERQEILLKATSLCVCGVQPNCMLRGIRQKIIDKVWTVAGGESQT